MRNRTPWLSDGFSQSIFSNYVLRFVKSPEPPETQSIAVHATKKRAVVDQAPRQNAGKAVTQRELADAQADFVMPDGILGMVVKDGLRAG